jgi:lysophospholipase L1-like esterase
MTVVGAGNIVSALGASQVIAVGAWPRFEGDGFYFWVISGSGGRFRAHPVEANGGEALSTTLSRAVNNFPTHLATYGSQPSHVVIQAGANNMDGAPSAALTTYGQILDALLEQGILPIVTELLPADTVDQMVHRIEYNVGLAHLAASRGLPFIRVPMELVDELTGGMVNAYAKEALGSGVHLNRTGAKIFGEHIAAKMMEGGISPSWEPPLALTNEATSVTAYKFSNPLFLDDTDDNGIPNGFSSNNGDSGSTSYALVDAGVDGVAGNWFQVTKSATTTDTILSASVSGLTAGNQVIVGWAAKYEGSAGSVAVAARITGPDDLIDDVYDLGADMSIVSRRWQPITIPSGITSLTFRFLMNAVGTFSLGQLTIIDVTSAGIEAWI